MLTQLNLMKIRFNILPSVIILSGLAIVSACNQSADKKKNTADSAKQVSDKPSFDTTLDGKPVHFFTLKNKSGMEATFTNYGAHLVTLSVPDKNGKSTNVVIGFNNVNDYKKAMSSYFGATIGRYGNRIAKGHFMLDGKRYDLFVNNKPNTLHGGKKGFNDVVWDAKQLNDQSIEFTYLSKDMEEGYPGNLNAKVTFTLTTDNGLKIDYEATTDKNTVVNLTNHSYFNLNGAGSGSILNHTLQVDAGKYIPVDSTSIPLGNIATVSGTPFDFTKPLTIGSRINTDNQQLKFGKGYDHNFVLNKHDISKSIATVTGDKSSIKMQIFTTEPGLQFYSGNFMARKNTIKGGFKDDYRSAIALETQHYPDSPNQPQFPSTELKPGQVYKSETIYKFSK